ncbi:phage regulatory CII family protein [Pusillimonas sp. SM2304]|uniref:phage regulatory CII family protein n=1 Tax=Pusillimonas sp. SM2304 TaxID=3073241 RepID=UPI002875DBD6|nr:phage regulatory CII family protein [Pusillimonas sp. SM2304]MDS1142412.1 phage regulatory CII family protein [Pusillimonas sp. SM2304]
MTLNSPTQLTIDFTPGLTERHACLLDCVRQGAYSHRNPLKTIAADMDMSQSELSRKLSDNPDDPRKLSVGDLEKYILATRDTTPIYWLIEKFLQDESVKQKQAMAALTKAMPDLLALLKAAQGAA